MFFTEANRSKIFQITDRERFYISPAVFMFCKVNILLFSSLLSMIIASVGRWVSGRWWVGWWSVDLIEPFEKMYFSNLRAILWEESKDVFITRDTRISIYFCVIVLQINSPSECNNSPTSRADCPTTLLYGFLVLQTVGPTQQQDYRYGSQDQCIVSPAFCKSINAPVKIIVA